MSLEARAYAVFVADDNDDLDIWERRFASDHQARLAAATTARDELRERVAQLQRDDALVPATLQARLRDAEDAVAAHAERELVILGGVHPDAVSVRTHLARAHEDGLPPELVVFDHRLSADDGGDALVAEGLALMRWYADHCAQLDEPVPPCVLWSHDFWPGLAQAFTDRGGRHALPRNLPGLRFTAELWSVLDDDAYAWRTPPSPTGEQLPLQDGQLLVLPYFEAGLSTPEIVARMRACGELPQVKDGPTWVNGKRSGIMKAANAFAERHGLVERFHKGQSEALARFARDHGHCWSALRYREA